MEQAARAAVGDHREQNYELTVLRLNGVDLSWHPAALESQHGLAIWMRAVVQARARAKAIDNMAQGGWLR